MGGLASIYSLGSPLAYKLTGININQEDLPWWATMVLSWCARVKALQEAVGNTGPAYRADVERIVKSGNPHDVYDRYESYIMALEIENSK